MNRLATTVSVALVAGFLAAAAPPACAWVDANSNGIDDPIEDVNQNGWNVAFEDNDPTKRMKIGVFQGAPISYGIYVGYAYHPTAADEAALTTTGVPYTKPYLYIDYIRTQATFAQIQSILLLPGVTRVESIPMMYPTNHIGSRVVRARDSRGLGASQNYVLFPSARQELGLDGTGQTIAILDTGVNDAQDSVNPGYPGHVSLQGKWLGGGEFFSGQPLLNTGLTESLNPEDHGDFHGTHVAGSAMGTGGVDGFFAGVAPAARLVDCKVLSDAGAGFGSADGIEWCIFNRNNDWGLTGADTIYVGIDVLNLSLGCLACDSDGSDAGSQMVNQAVNLGLSVCIASGNDDNQGSIGSPGGADLATTVGATGHFGTLDRSDDLVTSFSNEGPRTSDGDADQFDEYKPNVSAPGAGISSANGDWTTSGEGYTKLSGTSMSCPHVAGVSALVRQANPSITGVDIRRILENTSIHHLSSEKGDRPADPSGIDPNYSPMSGWGEVDVYAAALEAINSTTGVQVVRIRPIARALDGEVDVHWWTQREYPFLGFNVHRAPDVNGAPGAYTQLNGLLIPGTGDPVIDGALPGGDTNRTPYLFVDDDPGLVAGQTYWYQVEWVDLTSTAHPEPPAPATLGDPPLVASLFYSIRHNTPDNDLFVRFGTSAAYDPNAPEFSGLGEGTAGADSVVVYEPQNAATAVNGYLQYFWTVKFTTLDGVTPYLPPTMGNPWYIDVKDGCFVNRVGTMEAFSMFVNDSPGSGSGTTYVTDSPTPFPTIDTCVQGGNTTTTLWIPAEQPIPVEVAHLNIAGEADGVRIRLDLVEEDPGAIAVVHRGETSELSAATAITGPTTIDNTHFEHFDATAEPGQTYYYWVIVTERTGRIVMAGPVAATAARPSVAHTRVSAASPNPMAAHSVFNYTIGTDVAAGGDVSVQFTIHDLQGRVVRTLKDGLEPTGDYRVEWNGRNDSGQDVSAGIYYVKFRAGSMTRTSKVSVVR